MLQTNIFDFIGMSEDPLFIKLCSLDEGNTISVSINENIKFVIYKNIFGLYQLMGHDIDESFSRLSELYKFVNSWEVGNCVCVRGT